MDRLYSRLPKLYPQEDTNGILRDFLKALEIGGHDILFSDIKKLPDLLDIDKCPDEFLPLLSELFGYEYSVQIPALYQRRILKVIVDLYKRKGTQSAVKYIAREISGIEADIVENHEFEGQDVGITGWNISYANARKFIVKLIAPENTSDIQLKRDIVEILIRQFIPTNSDFLIVEAYFFADTRILDKDDDPTNNIGAISFKEEEIMLKNILENDCYYNITEPEEIKNFSGLEVGSSFLNSVHFKLNTTMILNSKGGFMTITNTSTNTHYTIFD